MSNLLILPQESLTCSICFDILDHPVECNNCHNLFCQSCIKDYITSKDKYRRLFFCPLCRNKKNNFKENQEVNNILNEYKISGKKICNKCKNIFDSNKIQMHYDKCWIKCIKCHKIFNNDEKFLEHFGNHGKNEMEKIINNYFNKKEEKNKKIEEEKNEDDCGLIQREKFENNLVKSNNSSSKEVSENNDSILVIDKNDYNSKYDLYFCGKNNNINCSCCKNKKCSPNGELCINCMKRNQKLHGLKKHYLINKKGKACKYSKGSFHCYTTYESIEKDNGGNFYKKQNICKGDFTCEACKNITKIMNFYLPAEIIKKLIERDL
jgi:hypothetical protein